MTTSTPGAIVRSFFVDHLTCQKGLSAATIHSYRDAVRLFLQFVAEDCGHRVSRVGFADLTAERVSRFLNALETKRHNHVRTRNQRLSVLRTFFDYLALREPEMLAQAEGVAAISDKRVAPPATGYLERDQIEALFAHLPKQGRFALRDHTLLLLLYNTGARVQEVADLRVNNLDLHDPPLVHLHGKGDKWRVCPLWQDTAKLLRQLLMTRACLECPDQPVFVSDRDQALTRFGIYKLVRRHTQHLTLAVGADAHHISPHCLRHSTAVHLLESGVEVNVIRAWLGHVSLETTNRYAELTMSMKTDALRQCEPPTQSSEGSSRRPAWRQDDDLLRWLESL
jgi:site-specific recombinase XerD